MYTAFADISCLAFRQLRCILALGLSVLLLGLSPAYSQAQAVIAPAIKIMPLGNSITHGKVLGSVYHISYRRALWLKLKEAKYNVDFVGSRNTYFAEPASTQSKDYDVDHEGQSGVRADEIGNVIRARATAAQPDIVLLHAGTNDIQQRQAIQETVNDVGEIIDELRLVNPNIKVLVAQVIPTTRMSDASGNPYKEFNDNITAYNALLPALVTTKSTTASPVVLVDQNSGFDKVNDLYDGLHPNPAGEEKMAAKWYQALVTVLGKPLPVNLVQFSARAVPAGIQLQWATASEQNNVSFSVERSSTGTEFTPVGRVAGRGTTTNRNTYSFLDTAPPLLPALYYRLRQTDTDSIFRFSGVVKVDQRPTVALLISPIPAQEAVVVSGVSPQVMVSIWNMRGQLVYQRPAQSSQFAIDIAQLANGVYHMQAGAQRARFIKQ